jgi:hypothetical protein
MNTKKHLIKATTEQAGQRKLKKKKEEKAVTI